MIPFKKIELEDGEWMEPLIKKANVQGCNQSFSSLFAWASTTETFVARIDDYAVIRTESDSTEYEFPIGTGDIVPVIKKMKAEAEHAGVPFVIKEANEHDVAALEKAWPGKIVKKPIRDYYDYVYKLDKLISLSGKKLHAKRNHINRFNKTYTDWSFEPIGKNNIDQAVTMNRQWCIQFDCKDDVGLSEENCATRRFFRYFDRLGLEGGLIRVKDKVVAFTVGKRLNEDTYVIHLEKAFRDVPGAYAVINQSFCEYVKDLYPMLKWMNREEDLGYEGMRKAKRSYRPHTMLKKYRVEC